MKDLKFRAWGKNSKEFLQDKSGYGLSLKEIQNIEDIDLWEFTQYSGLKDKNEKEIYEGDIIKNLLSGSIDVIEYGKDFMPVKKYREVIGNIYETPELTK